MTLEKADHGERTTSLALGNTGGGAPPKADRAFSLGRAKVPRLARDGQRSRLPISNAQIDAEGAQRGKKYSSNLTNRTPVRRHTIVAARRRVSRPSCNSNWRGSDAAPGDMSKAPEAVGPLPGRNVVGGCPGLLVRAKGEAAVGLLPLSISLGRLSNARVRAPAVLPARFGALAGRGPLPATERRVSGCQGVCTRW